MTTTYDAVVVGLGAVGSAAVYQLARRGYRVLGLDRYTPPHTLGSSHSSRIFRKAYFEGERYVPLIERGYALWRELEAESGRALLRITGGLNIGAEGSDIVEGAQRVAAAYDVAHEVLTREDVQERFPAYDLPEGHLAVWEAGAGALFPDACIQTHLDQARRHGATLHFDEPVSVWEPDGDGVEVISTKAAYRAGRLVLCAGGWIKEMLGNLGLPVFIERQVIGWFRPKHHAPHFDAARCPVFIWQAASGHTVYGFPDFGRGVKAGIHHLGTRVDHPDALAREPTAADEATIRTHLRHLMPNAVGPLVRIATCFYTNTPDQHYLIDRHPDHPQVVFASACSGHGFKASNAVGEALVALVMEDDLMVPLDAFRWRW